jgi:hypothetical protein
MVNVGSVDASSDTRFLRHSINPQVFYPVQAEQVGVRIGLGFLLSMVHRASAAALTCRLV